MERQGRLRVHVHSILMYTNLIDRHCKDRTVLELRSQGNSKSLYIQVSISILIKEVVQEPQYIDDKRWGSECFGASG